MCIPSTLLRPEEDRAKQKRIEKPMQSNQTEAPLEMDDGGVVFNLKSEDGDALVARLNWNQFEDFWILVNIAVSQIPDESLKNRLGRIGAKYGGSTRGERDQGGL